MKKILIILLLITMYACSINTKHLEIKNEVPEKIIYGRMYEYGDTYEINNQEYIDKIYSALRNIEYSKPTQKSVMDFTDILIFIYKDGSEERYEFEENIYVLSNNERYEVVEGLGYLRKILNEYVEESNGGQ